MRQDFKKVKVGLAVVVMLIVAIASYFIAIAVKRNWDAHKSVVRSESSTVSVEQDDLKAFVKEANCSISVLILDDYQDLNELQITAQNFKNSNKSETCVVCASDDFRTGVAVWDGHAWVSKEIYEDMSVERVTTIIRECIGEKRAAACKRAVFGSIAVFCAVMEICLFTVIYLEGLSSKRLSLKKTDCAPAEKNKATAA